MTVIALACLCQLATPTTILADDTDWSNSVLCAFDEVEQSNAPYIVLLFTADANGRVVWTDDESLPGLPASVIENVGQQAFTFFDRAGNSTLVSTYFGDPSNPDQLGVGILSRHAIPPTKEDALLRWQAQTGQCFVRGKGIN